MKYELGNLMAEDPQQETINLLTYRLNAVSTELAAVTEQRDRLAETMRNCMPFISSEGMGEYHDAREALAAVKGGADE